MTRREFAAAALATPVLLNAAQAGNPREFFYRPEGAWAADFIPLFDNGKYHLFYLLDWRDKTGHGEGTPWYQIETDDFVHFKEYGESFRGAPIRTRISISSRGPRSKPTGNITSSTPAITAQAAAGQAG